MCQESRIANRVSVVEGRLMSLEQWSNDVAQSFNTVEGRGANPEQWSEELAESL